MCVSPSMPPPLPASCFGGNPISPLSEGGATPSPQLEASPPPQTAELLCPHVITPRHRRSPTPVKLLSTRLRTHTTPTHWGGESSVHIHRLHHDREVSMQPSAVSSNTAGDIPTTVVIPPSPSSGNQQGLTPSNTAGHIPSGIIILSPPIPNAC